VRTSYYPFGLCAVFKLRRGRPRGGLPRGAVSQN
jgi:hypothetical protein